MKPRVMYGIYVQPSEFFTSLFPNVTSALPEALSKKDKISKNRRRQLETTERRLTSRMLYHIRQQHEPPEDPEEDLQERFLWHSGRQKRIFEVLSKVRQRLEEI